MKKSSAPNIDCLRKFLTAQPDRKDIQLMDEENAKADEAAKRNAATRARRNIKGGNHG